MEQTFIKRQWFLLKQLCLKILWMWLFVTFVILIVAVAMFLSSHQIKSNKSEIVNTSLLVEKIDTVKWKTSENFSVVVKESLADKTKSDVYLKNEKIGERLILATLTDVYRGHYHKAEYHNGSLYIIRRTGGDVGYETNPNWTDELWQYNQQKQGKMLYSVRGLDFRVSDDEKLIAIIGSDTDEEKLVFIKTNGVILKTFDRNKIWLENYNPILWTENYFWISDFFGPHIQNIVKIKISNFQASKFDVSDLPITIREFDLNPIREKIVFSDYPAIFDADSYDDFRARKKVVNLFVYDLKRKDKLIIATSTAKEFNPKWIDKNTLEYDAPSGNDRETYVLQNQK